MFSKCFTTSRVLMPDPSSAIRISEGMTVYFYTMSAQMKTLIDRCCAGYLEIRDKEFYFIVAAAETSVAAMERTIDGFRGFLDCLDNPQEKGVVYGVGAWHKGDIQGKPAMKQA